MNAYCSDVKNRIGQALDRRTVMLAASSLFIFGSFLGCAVYRLLGIGRSELYDRLIERLQVDLSAPQNGMKTVCDHHGEVESFFNILVYETGFRNIRFISSENFDTKDNDYVQYKLSFARN